MKKLLIALATTVALVGPAAACLPPDPEDSYKTPSGQVFEVVKVNSDTCYFKLCVRPYGSRKDCRWIKDPTTAQGYNWVTLNGVTQ